MKCDDDSSNAASVGAAGACDRPWRPRLRWGRMGRLSPVVLCSTLALVAGAASGQVIEMPSAVLVLSEEVNLSAESDGVLEELAVHEGSLVARGDVVARIRGQRADMVVRRARLEAELAERRALDDVNVRHAVKTRDLAVADLERSQAINAKIPNTVSVRDMARLELAVEVAQLDIERAGRALEDSAAEAALKRVEQQIAELELARHVIATPIDGMVIRREKRSGEWVRSGDVVVRIVRIDVLRAEGFVDASLAPVDLVGRRARVRIEQPPGTRHELAGRVAFVNPEANPVNMQVKVWVEFQVGDARLRPGLRAHVWIDGRSESAGATALPAATDAAVDGESRVD
ncbi:MAG TPA: HlyD family efflux transporter periplasmic adaptor subunit [Lacipirellulaceae bacterium]|nr:HlyD family efflux transporter periplasmic adaptor subunit [Lacipirellulaceae bacterium]